MAFRGASSATYTFASGNGATVDLGATNNYRYINATNVYNKGKADGVGSIPMLYKGTFRYINSNAYCIISLVDSDASNEAALSGYTYSPSVTLGAITAKLTYVNEGAWTASIQSTDTGKLYVNGNLVKTWTTSNLSAYTFNFTTNSPIVSYRVVMD